MPSPLPSNIPDTSVLAGRPKKCANGNALPEYDGCDTTLAKLLEDVQSYLYCVMNAVEISKYPGSCGILRVVNGSVKITGLSILIDECLSCLAPEKICPGNEGQVLTTVSGKAKWAPASGGSLVTCGTIEPLLQKDSCIEAGSNQQYSLGYDATSRKLQYFPSGGPGFISNCAELRSRMETSCFTNVETAPTYVLGKNAAGVSDWYKPAASAVSGPGFITDCAGLKDKVKTCFTDQTDTATKVLSDGPSGVGWRVPAVSTGGGGTFDCAALLPLLKSCPPDASPTDAVTKILAYDSTGAAKKFELYKPYHGEVRAAGDPASATNAGGAKVQELAKVWGGAVGGLQDIVGLWAGGTYNFSGAGVTFDVATGRYKILKKGRYQVSLGLFFRMSFSGGGSLLANAYGGVTVKRPATSYNGTTYRADSAIYRMGQQNFYADGKPWDSSIQGSVTLALDAGSELWARVVMANTSPGITIVTAQVRDDGASHFNVSQLPDIQLFSII